MVTKKREAYADNAKGILILFLVLHHLHIQSELKGITNTVTIALDIIDDYWIMFFMAAFFVLSAMFSSFNMSFGQFFQKNFRTLIIPSVVFGLLNGIIYQSTIGVMGRFGYLSSVYNAIVGFVKNGGFLWFCSALFIAKLIFWLINKKINKSSSVFYVCCVLSTLGIVIGYIFYIYKLYEVWSFIHSLIFIVFLSIGKVMRNIDLNKCCGIALCVLTFCLTYYLQKSNLITTVTYGLEGLKYEAVIFYVMAVFGTLSLIFVSKRIGNNKLLGFIGKNSLVYYGIHPIFNSIFTEYFKDKLVGSTIFMLVCYYSLIFLLIFIFSSMFVYLFNTKYGRYLLGKW